MPGGVAKTEIRTYQLYINGEWVASTVQEDFPGVRSLDAKK